MQFLKAVAFGTFALVSLAAAQSTVLAFTSTPASVTAGQGASLKWMAQSENEPVTIILRKGDPANLETITVITSSATKGSYDWIVPNWLADASDYALQILQGDQVNYSGEFSLSGANPSAVSTASAATASALAAGSALTSSVSQMSAISSIQSAIASYNATLNNLTAPANTSTSMPASAVASATMGTGIPMSRNMTLSSATLVGASTGSPRSSAGGATATVTSMGSGTTGGAGAGTATSASASVTSSGAAVLTGSSPLALVFCAVAFLLY